MGLIDSHCHLDRFGTELMPVIRRAHSSGISHMIAVGTEPKDWEFHCQLASDIESIDYTVGLHPSNIEENWECDLEIMHKFLTSQKKPVAIGEIGLDFHFLPSDSTRETIIDLQKTVFTEQLKIANQFQLPIVIHSRDAFEECMNIVENCQCNWEKVVVHCFSESPTKVTWLNSRGARASFTGNITYPKNEVLRQSLITQGANLLMLETDCPFLTPVPYRKFQNEPFYLKETANFVAKLLNMDVSELILLTEYNTRTFFDLR